MIKNKRESTPVRLILVVIGRRSPTRQSQFSSHHLVLQQGNQQPRPVSNLLLFLVRLLVHLLVHFLTHILAHLLLRLHVVWFEKSAVAAVAEMETT